VDWTLIVLVLVFAVRGFLRGAVAQVFVLAGWFLGFWAMLLVSQWVGAHWKGARPTAVFWVLRWIVSGLAGVAVLSLFAWWGAKLGEALRKGPFEGVDRLLGFAVGGGVGLVVVTLMLLAVLRLPDVLFVAHPVARARLTPAVLAAADAGCRRAGPALPAGVWLRRQMSLASQRVQHQPEAPSRARRA
jgi:uncharacterized membrane protein required for colicin V production